ncbi:MAG: hypothetical protein IPO58_00270 [Betaproteobacteria bacterium]|nr:hypothetical protein [Betaproteobacteria bacterium]MBK8740005.1 hypothetical protein [Betaproteobacteria bacterium]MBK9604932.1 hypothetical protein [Betaproteobacteria bacterium]
MNIEQVIVSTLFATAMLAAAGCTTAAWYEGMKRSAENECRRQPADESERCLARLNKKTYEEYEKERTGQKKS